MKDYESRSNLEINKEVFFKVGIEYEDRISTKYLGSSVHYSEDVKWYTIDPCNNILDAWPLIIDNNICIHNDKRVGYTYANTFDDYGYVKHECYDDNALRAAMIVFLKIKGSE